MADDTQLIEALQAQKIDEARELLKTPGNIPESLDSFSNVPVFDILLRTKAFDILELFIGEGLLETDIYEYDDLERSFFDPAFRLLQDDEESVAFMKGLLAKLSNVNDSVRDQTLLGLALEKKAKPAIIKALIDGGCDVNTVNNAEYTYLHHIAKNYNPDASLTVAYAQLLIDSGADVNAVNVVADTPLMLAISNGKKQLSEVLLDNGARANEQNKEGKTAYYMATVDQQSLEVYELLKKYELPDFEKKTKDGVAFFFEYLNRISGSYSPYPGTLVKAMMEDGASLFEGSMHYGVKKTPFDILATKPFEIFELVVKTGDIDVAHTDNDGNTLLHKVAAYDVNYDQNAARDTYKKTKMLLEMGADANAANNRDETAMMLAATDNLKSKTVELLLQHSK
ncbi:ankyrin repeat domain-containing protein [uncultured Flavobacterium sp.]|uniref:ankyrin repeat domain-containing protein n=1 Tax=uncultured Flavobacterium sp. TaxID=165435 RepID=UPI0025D98901|nr:ankyrin repeat domain-containing protein [uncultured Flavobacterium sp.]